MNWPAVSPHPAPTRERNAAHATALDAYRAVAHALQRRSRGQRAQGALAPDWADPCAVQSISMQLHPSSDGRPPRTLAVALRDGVPGSVLPRRWQPQHGGPCLDLIAVRAPRVRAQAAPAVVRERSPSAGTATALVRDRLTPARNYVLTCGHVVAPDADTCFHDTARIGGGCIGYLAEWQPAIGVEVYRTGIDAALLEVTPDDAVALRAEPALLPTGVGGDWLGDLPVTLRRCDGPLAGRLRVFWSGFVDLPGISPGFPDYFLTDAIGYETDTPTHGGDSGAAVWDGQERLVGMHIGALPDTAAGEANAVLSPIVPVLDWFAVQPYTRSNPAALAPVSAVARTVPATSTAVPGAASPRELSIVARTLWGEARGEGPQGMRAVACVVANRARLRWRGAEGPAEVCLAFKQFSCWNDGDPNRALLDRIESAPDANFRQALDLAAQLAARTLTDITGGATHYVASTLRRRPPWLDGKTPCAVIGRHEFYKDIA